MVDSSDIANIVMVGVTAGVAIKTIDMIDRNINKPRKINRKVKSKRHKPYSRKKEKIFTW